MGVRLRDSVWVFWWRVATDKVTVEVSTHQTADIKEDLDVFAAGSSSQPDEVVIEGGNTTVRARATSG